MTDFRQWQKIRQSGVMHKATKDELDVTKVHSSDTSRVDTPVGRSDNDNDKPYE